MQVETQNSIHSVQTQYNDSTLSTNNLSMCLNHDNQKNKASNNNLKTNDINNILLQDQFLKKYKKNRYSVVIQ